MKKQLSLAYVIRHGKTEWNTSGIYQGIYDSPLTQEGIKQARKVGDYFQDKKIDKIFCSSLGRAQQTAEIISKKIGIEITTIPEFKEMNFGSFQKKSKEKVQAIFKDFFTSHKENPYYKLFIPYPDGESYFNVYQRVLPVVLKLLVRNNNFIIVGHESVNRMIRGIIMKKALKDMVMTRQKNNEIAVLDIANNTEEIIVV